MKHSAIKSQFFAFSQLYDSNGNETLKESTSLRKNEPKIAKVSFFFLDVKRHENYIPRSYNNGTLRNI